MNYEKPVLIDFALGDRAEGATNCKSGASAAKKCSLGSGVGGGGPVPGNCKNGSSAAGKCRAGASASRGCSLGSLAK
ncbi:MAG: hypothetical protein JRD69_01085 [Deltaproteobacteria bacterium]|nr:hypothetical protein [Deltaproteobacteria bacterium]